MTRKTFCKVMLSLLQTMGVVLLIAGCAAPIQAPTPVPIPVFPPPPDEARFIYERTLFSSADVEKSDSNFSFMDMMTGAVKGAYGMGKPYGLAVYHGQVYVSDAGNHVVEVFDIPGQRFYKIGEEDNDGRLIAPLGLDLDGKGNLYVVDSNTKQVNVYDKNGKYQRNFAGPTFFKRPSGIAVDAAGSRAYVIDTGGIDTDEHRIRVFDAQKGDHLFDIGKRGTDDGQFNLPRDVTIGKDDFLYVVDGGNFRVQVFKPDGTFVRKFGSIGRQGGQFSRPKEVAADADGNVYVVDSAFGNFQIFNPEGQLLLAVGSRSEKGGMAKFMLPSGIAVDGDGRVYMVDQFFKKIDVFRPAKLAPDEGFAVISKVKAAPK